MKATVDHQIQSPPAWVASEGGLFSSDSQFGVYTVMMDVALPVKLLFVSQTYSII
jgi:hypothetical protein